MKFDWQMYPAQKKFMEDDRPRVLYGGGLTSKGYWIQLFRRLLEMELKAVEELRCPHCTNDNPLMFTFSNRLRDRVNVHCETCSKDFIQVFRVGKETVPLPIDKEPQ